VSFDRIVDPKTMVGNAGAISTLGSVTPAGDRGLRGKSRGRRDTNT
jgi:hypothetical protein